MPFMLTATSTDFGKLKFDNAKRHRVFTNSVLFCRKSYMMMFVNQIKNPYCFRVSNVRVEYAKERKENLTEAFSAMLAML